MQSHLGKKNVYINLKYRAMLWFGHDITITRRGSAQSQLIFFEVLSELRYPIPRLLKRFRGKAYRILSRAFHRVCNISPEA